MDQFFLNELAEKYPHLGQVVCVQSDVWKEVLGEEWIKKNPELPFFLTPANVMGLQAKQGLEHGKLAASIERVLSDEAVFADRSETAELIKGAYKIMLSSYFADLPQRVDRRLQDSAVSPQEQAPAAILAMNLWSEDPRTDEASWFLWVMVGNAYLRMTDYVRAAEYLNKAVELNPGSPEALNELGLLYAVQNDYTKAKELFHRALLLAPDDFRTLAHLGAACMESGHRGEALTYLRRAHDANPTDDKIAKLLKVAEALKS